MPIVFMCNTSDFVHSFYTQTWHSQSFRHFWPVIQAALFDRAKVLVTVTVENTGFQKKSVFEESKLVTYNSWGKWRWLESTVSDKRSVLWSSLTFIWSGMILLREKKRERNQINAQLSKYIHDECKIIGFKNKSEKIVRVGKRIKWWY